jgi:hypothetical protein
MHVEGDTLFPYAAADSIAMATGLPWPEVPFLSTDVLDLQLPTIDAPCQAVLFASDSELGALQFPTNDLMGRRLSACRPHGSKAKECTNGASCTFCVKKRHLKEKRPAFCRTFNAKGACTNGAACLGC